MKIAISSSGKDLQAEIDPRFGRCAYFLFVDTEDMKFEAHDNESIAMSGGAGIQAAEFVSSKGAEAVLTGNCGPNAVRALQAAGVKLFTGQSGRVRDALEAFTKGKLVNATAPNVPDHYGMGGGQSTDQQINDTVSPGWGQGRGMGRGQGCGRGMRKNPGGMGQYRESFGGTQASTDEEGDLTSLKQQTMELKTQIEELESRLRRLEKE